MAKKKQQESWQERFKSFVVHTFREWSVDGTQRMGAGIAYYGIIALIPFLIVAVSMAEIFFTSFEIQQFFVGLVETIFGNQASTIIPELEVNQEGEVLEGVYNLGLIGLGGLLFAASLIFLALQDALNVIWKTKKKGMFSLKRYALAFGVMLMTGAVVTSILVAHGIISYARNLLPEDVGVFSLFSGVASVAVVFVITVTAILLLLRSLINAKINLKDLVLSSAITASLMYLGVFGLAVYFSNFADKSIYGAFTGLILVLIAIYYFAQIFLIGAQMGKVVAYRRGNTYLQKHLKQTDPQR